MHSFIEEKKPPQSKLRGGHYFGRRLITQSEGAQAVSLDFHAKSPPPAPQFPSLGSQARRRLELVSSLPRLDVTDEARELARAFLSTGALPLKAVRDAAHLAVAAVAGVDYLLTWNCRHLANAEILRRLEREAQVLEWELPWVCTPLELMGDFYDETEFDT